jgi:hypothetical protein
LHFHGATITRLVYGTDAGVSDPEHRLTLYG